MTKKIRQLCVALVTGTLFAGSAPALDAQTVSVRGVSVRTVTLELSGEAVSLALTGASLDQVTQIRVMSQGRPVRDIEVKIERASASRLDVTMLAGGFAPAGRGYTLTLTAGRRTIDVAARMLTIGVTAAAPAPVLRRIQLEKSSIEGGQGFSFTVSLDQPAPRGGVRVTLSSAQPRTLRIPSEVTIPAGQTSIEVTASTTAVTRSLPVRFSATAGQAAVEAEVEVTPPPQPPAITGVTLSETSLSEGDAATGVVSLDRPALRGGLVITLSASPGGIASLPSSLTIPAGQTQGEFEVGYTTAVTANTPVNITVSAPGTQGSASITVEPGQIRDLRVGSISPVFTEETQPPRRARLSVIVENVGTVAMAGNLYCAINGSQAPITWGPAFTGPHIPAIDPGSSASRTFGYPLPELWSDFSVGQSLPVECRVEPRYDTETDVNSDNDVLSVSVEVPPITQPDLQVPNITARPCGGPGTPTDDQPLCIWVDYRATSGWVINQSFQVVCTLDGQSMTKEDDAATPNQNIATLDFGIKEAGSYSVTCTVDTGNTVSETNEGNNSKTVTITVVEGDIDSPQVIKEIR